MKHIVFTLLIFIFAMPGCVSKNTLQNLGWSEGCPLERLNWMEVSAEYDSKEIIDITSRLAVAIESDLSDINSKGNASGELGVTLNDIVNSKGGGKIKVSQEFYENYINKRTGVCTIYQGIKDGIIDDEVAKKSAQDVYIELARSFSEIKIVEEKKSR